ncbi:MAG: hypothetical protein B2I17_06070 [Thermoplasmatales archaeon B_DKE]|nr:MAG: hypothetical protein B2I17_06070 [Thermoplasmatales archaeon B_DKE]QRF75738.1 hypothetical protein Thermo_01244 [Thermoplasmatales archaeon]
MESIGDNTVLDQKVSKKDIIAVVTEAFCILAVLSMLFDSDEGAVHSSGISPNILPTSGGGGGLAYPGRHKNLKFITALRGVNFCKW